MTVIRYTLGGRYGGRLNANFRPAHMADFDKAGEGGYKSYTAR